MRGISLILLLFATLAQGQEPPPRGGVVRMADIAKILRDARPNSVEALLERLPPQLFDDYVLMRESKSLQEATPTQPRVILSGGGGDLILAYGGTGKTVEAIEFDPSTRRWNFYNIDFSKGGEPLSPPNPQECKSCHQENLRPNWHPYALWPGAYDQDDDSFESERKQYDAFIKQHGGNPRYRHLPHLSTHYDRVGDTPSANTRFTVNLNRRNLERIAQELKARPDYENIRFAVAAASVPGCVRLDKEGNATLAFLPPESALRKRVESALSAKFKAAQSAFQSIPGVEFQSVLAILEATGTPASAANWSLAFGMKALYYMPGKILNKDPLSHGLGGTTSLVPWGMARVDDEIAKAVQPFLDKGYPLSPPPDKATPAQLRTHRLGVTATRAPLIDDKHRSAACEELTRRSLVALKGYSPGGVAPPAPLPPEHGSKSASLDSGEDSAPNRKACQSWARPPSSVHPIEYLISGAARNGFFSYAKSLLEHRWNIWRAILRSGRHRGTDSVCRSRHHRSRQPPRMERRIESNPPSAGPIYCRSN